MDATQKAILPEPVASNGTFLSGSVNSYENKAYGHLFASVALLDLLAASLDSHRRPTRLTQRRRWAYALAVQSDGKILVGGAFEVIRGALHYTLRGSMPMAFRQFQSVPRRRSFPDVYSLAVQADGGFWWWKLRRVHSMTAVCYGTKGLLTSERQPPSQQGSIWSLRKLGLGAVACPTRAPEIAHPERNSDHPTRAKQITMRGVLRSSVLSGLFSWLNFSPPPTVVLIERIWWALIQTMRGGSRCSAGGCSFKCASMPPTMLSEPAVLGGHGQ